MLGLLALALLGTCASVSAKGSGGAPKSEKPHRAHRHEKTQVYLFIGQSNMVGRGNADELTDEENKRMKEAGKRVKLFYRGSDLNDVRKWAVRKQDRPLNVTTAEPETKKIFRMDRYFGPELFFGITMAEAAPGKKFLLIKDAFPGASLVASFNPNWDKKLIHETQPECVEHNSFSWCNESFYATALADVKHHLAADENAEFAGVLAVQGEKEVRLRKKFPWVLERYAEILENSVRRFRRDTGRPELPFVTVDTFNGQVNKEMQKVADKMKGVTVLHDKKGPDPDHLPRWSFNFRHFDTEGQRRLGRRFAEAMLASPGPARRAYRHNRKNRKSKATAELVAAAVVPEAQPALAPQVQPAVVPPPVNWSEMTAVSPQQ